MILIFTNKEDAHPNPVIDILTERGVPFFRLNTEDLLTDYSFEWHSNPGEEDFSIRNLASGLTLKGSEVTALWDRRPEAPKSLPVKNTPEIDAHNRAEALGFLNFLRYYLKDIPSIGSIVNDRVSSSKMLQIELARSLGFAVPDTLFSNRKEDFIAFAATHPYLCLKDIDNGDVCIGDDDWVFFAQKLDSSQLRDIPEEAFSQTVTFAQEYIEKAFELRVTVVGGEVFATKILSQEMKEGEGAVDWRQGYEHGIKWEAYDLDEATADKCQRIVWDLGLDFGCLDLIVRPDGEVVFLECNPNGQWLWIELATGQKISKAIADFLEEAPPKEKPLFW